MAAARGPAYRSPALWVRSPEGPAYRAGLLAPPLWILTAFGGLAPMASRSYADCHGPDP